MLLLQDGNIKNINGKKWEGTKIDDDLNIIFDSYIMLKYRDIEKFHLKQLVRYRIKHYRKTNQRRNIPRHLRNTLFLLKGNALKKREYLSIINYIKQRGYMIVEMFWTVIDNKEKFFKKFYNHISPKIIERESNVNFSNICLAIITNDDFAKVNSVVVKYAIRERFGPHSVHASDDWRRAKEEIRMLKNETKLDYRGISTTFSD